MKPRTPCLFALSCLQLLACGGTSRPSVPDARADTLATSPADRVADSPPACIDQLISAAQAAPVGNPPVSFSRCTYQGQTVYYEPAQCCDQWSALYAADCTVICAPDGGFSGMGDGRCPDFDGATCTLIWQDSRTR